MVKHGHHPFATIRNIGKVAGRAFRKYFRHCLIILIGEAAIIVKVVVILEMLITLFRLFSPFMMM